MKYIVALLMIALCFGAGYSLGYTRGESARRLLEWDKGNVEFISWVQSNEYEKLSDLDRQRIASNMVELPKLDEWQYNLKWYDSESNKRTGEIIRIKLDEIKKSTKRKPYLEIMVLCDDAAAVDKETFKKTFRVTSGTMQLQKGWAFVQTELTRTEVENISANGPYKVIVVREHK